MKKLLQLKTMLLLCALIVGSGSVWADPVTLVSGSGTSGYTVPEGWTSSGTIEGGSYLKFDDGSITSPVFAPHTSLSFTYSVATFQSGTNHPLIIRILDASNDEVLVEKQTETPTSSTYISTGSPLSLGDVYVSFKIQLYGSTGKGVRLRNYSITGTPASSDPAISVSKSSLSFGEVEATGSKEMTFTVTPSNLTAGLTLSTNNDLYTVSPKSIASNATGAQTITVTANPTSVNDDMDGKVIISGDDFDDDTEVSLSTTVIRKSAGLSFSPTSVELTKDDEFSAPTFTKDAGINASDITFTTTYAGVATVSDEGVISLGGNTGTAIIRASFAQTDVYDADNVTCTITVNPAGVVPEPSAAGYYVKVTRTEDLTTGRYLIVSEDYTNIYKSSEPADETYNSVSVTISESIIEESERTLANEFYIDMTDGSIKAATGKYIGRTNGKKTGIDITDDAQAHSISISDGDAVVTCTGTDATTMYLRYNSAADQQRFRYYPGESVKSIQLYKHVAGSDPDDIDIYVSAAGLATYASNFDLDYTNVDGLEAYIAVEDNGAVKYNKVSKVPAGEGVLLRATDGGGKNYTVPTAASTDVMTGNLLKRGNDAAVASTESTNFNYILNVVNNQIGFYRAAGQTVAKNRAYLQTTINAGTSARIDIFFDDDTNGIKKIENVASNKENGTFFNLAGQRVAQPSKGLYIVNGRKVIVK